MTPAQRQTPPPTGSTRNGWSTALRGALVLMLLCGGAYPLVATWMGSRAFPGQAAGSLIDRGGCLVGSALIGQPFAAADWFHGRPSAAGYDPLGARGSNLAPSNRALQARAQLASRAIAEANRVSRADVPTDLIAASGSGLDPHISPAAARLQVSRVARARHLPEPLVRAWVEQAVEPKTWGVLGAPRVNVLRLNLRLSDPARAAPDGG